LLLVVALVVMAPAAQEQKSPALRDQALQLLGDAAASAHGVESDVERGKVLAEIAAAQWAAGDRTAAEANFQQAQQALESPQPADAKPELTSYYQGWVATARAKAGDFEGAAEAITALQNPTARTLALDNLVAAQLKAGKVDDAARTALELEDGNSRDTFLAATVTFRVRSGDLEGAAKMVEVINRPEHKAPALAALAVGYAKAKQPERAKAFMAEALRLAKESDPGEPKASRGGFWPGCQYSGSEAPGDPMLESVALSQAQMGDLSGAFETLERIQTEARKENLLAALASFQGQAKDFRGARATTDRIKRQSCRAQAQEFVALQELRARDLSGAAATIAAIKEPVSKARALTKLAEAQVNTDQPALALETLAYAQELVLGEADNLQRSQALAQIGIWQARAGRRDLATQAFADALAAARAHDEHGPPGAVQGVAQRQAEAGFVAEALGSTEAAPPQARLMILRRLMQAAGRGGSGAEAVVGAQALASPLEKANALLGLAEGLLQRAESEKSER